MFNDLFNKHERIPILVNNINEFMELQDILLALGFKWGGVSNIKVNKTFYQCSNIKSVVLRKDYVMTSVYVTFNANIYEKVYTFDTFRRLLNIYTI